MSVKLTGKLIAPFSTELKHESGALIQTTAPKDNGGEGNLFSPTDLFAASLASCALTVIALYAKKNNIPIALAEFVLEKEMNSTPRRVKKISVVYSIQTTADDATFKKLEAAAKTCPVRASMHPDIEIFEQFERI